MRRWGDREQARPSLGRRSRGRPTGARPRRRGAETTGSRSAAPSRRAREPSPCWSACALRRASRDNITPSRTSSGAASRGLRRRSPTHSTREHVANSCPSTPLRAHPAGPAAGALHPSEGPARPPSARARPTRPTSGPRSRAALGRTPFGAPSPAPAKRSPKTAASPVVPGRAGQTMGLGEGQGEARFKMVAAVPFRGSTGAAVALEDASHSPRW